MGKEILPGLRGEIDSGSAIERLPVVNCTGCGCEMDPASEIILTRIINGVEIQGRAYCGMCRQMVALKESWMPGKYRISNMFVIKS